MHEYEAGVQGKLLPANAWSDLPVVVLTAAEAGFARELPPRLGAGERSGIAVAHSRQGIFVSDDRDARRVAHSVGIPVTGTLGILVRCVQLGFLARVEANLLLDGLIAAGYRSPVSSLDPLLDD
jgi:predicted nucleic acid-binding protein